MGAVLAADCERARSWASLGLDGELSEVESALLSAHVGRCAECAEFARDVDVLTQELRAMPCIRPRMPRIPARRRSSGVRVLQLGVATVAIVIAAGLGSVAGSLTSRPALAKVSTFSAESLRFANAVAAQQQLHPVKPA
jgi:predicted anti-sigma-YlaC factor YlaD